MSIFVQRRNAKYRKDGKMNRSFNNLDDSEKRELIIHFYD